MKLGKPQYEKTKKNYFSFKKDSNTFVLRVLPPMGKLADKGKWSIYHRVEFGYSETGGRIRPFLSPRVVNYEGMVEVESYTHLRRVTLKDQMEQAKAAGNKELEDQINTTLRKYNQDCKHYMNVIDLNGNIGLFKIGHRGFQSLKAEIDRLRAEGVDPISAESGRFFVFSRSGQGRDTIYTVVEYKQKVEMELDGQKIIVDKPFPHAIGETIIQKLSSEAFELGEVYPTVTSEQEKSMVELGSEAVDKVFARPAKIENKIADIVAEEATVAETAPTEQQTAQAETIIEPSTTTVAVDPVTTAALSTETPVTSTLSASVPLTELSEADFLKKLEAGNM